MLIMQLCQPLVLIFQFFKIFEQRTSAPPKFEFWFRPCPKLFEYTFCTLNYNSCYTLHHDVKFSVNLDGNSKFRMQSVIRNII